MSGWDFNAGSGNSQKAEFTKFPVGVTRIRVIDSEPTARWTHWIQKQKRSINCPGKGCPICEVRRQQKANKEPQTYPMGMRLAMNVENLETGKIEIMEQGKTFFEDLRDVMIDIKEKGKSLEDAILKVRRRGTDKDDTSYRIDLDELSPLSSDKKTDFESKKIKLNEFFKPHTPEQILRIMNGEAWDDVMKAGNEEDNAPDDEEVTIR